MRAIIVGLGTQGRKRLAVAGAEAVATVDPVTPEAQYRGVEDVPLDSFDAALVCTPDRLKLAILDYLLANRKHVLVEKPLVAADRRSLERLHAMATDGRVACYTAYNHRFEPHLVAIKQALESGRVGRVYLASFFYGNGTACLVRESGWRDHGTGVIPDLASHLLDLSDFLFGRPAGEPDVWSARHFENAAPDYFLLGYPDAAPMLKLEGTLLSWRNTFRLDVIGDQGSAHVFGLCKWGPSRLVLRRRVLPSGRPDEEEQVLEQSDPTWAIEYEHFKALCRSGGTNIATDIWINDVLNGVAQRLGIGVGA